MPWRAFVLGTVVMVTITALMLFGHPRVRLAADAALITLSGPTVAGVVGTTVSVECRRPDPLKREIARRRRPGGRDGPSHAGVAPLPLRGVD